jgi:hypothetical protein
MLEGHFRTLPIVQHQSLYFYRCSYFKDELQWCIWHLRMQIHHMAQLQIMVSILHGKLQTQSVPLSPHMLQPMLWAQNGAVTVDCLKMAKLIFSKLKCVLEISLLTGVGLPDARKVKFVH